MHKIGNSKKSKTYDFQKFKTRMCFRREVQDRDITLNDAFKEHEIDKYKENSKPKNLKREKIKLLTNENRDRFLKGR